MSHAPYLNLDAIDQAKLQMSPFPYMIIPQLLRPEVIEGLIQDFPKIDKLGSFPHTELNYGDHFKHLIAELEGESLRTVISQKFDMQLNQSPPMITVRGKTGTRDGKIHTDSKDKRITILLYMNHAWESTGGQLRLLNNGKDLENYVAEVPPLAGTCIIFKVTDNCWHGHKPFLGVRRTIQLNYVTNEQALNKHINKHRFSAKFKKLKQWLTRSPSM